MGWKRYEPPGYDPYVRVDGTGSLDPDPDERLEDIPRRLHRFHPASQDVGTDAGPASADPSLALIPRQSRGAGSTPPARRGTPGDHLPRAA